MINDKQSACRAKWQALIKEQEASGLSQRQFCKESHVSSAQLSYYRGVLKPQQPQMASFTPVTVKQAVSLKDIRITLPNGFQCVFPADLSASEAKEWIRVLLSC